MVAVAEPAVVQLLTQKSVQNCVPFMLSRPHSTHRGQLSTCPIFSLAFGASTPPRVLLTQSALAGLRRQSPFGGGHCASSLRGSGITEARSAWMHIFEFIGASKAGLIQQQLEGRGACRAWAAASARESRRHAAASLRCNIVARRVRAAVDLLKSEEIWEGLRAPER